MYKKPIITIIIPIYGVELYVEKCLTSILAQSFTNFEAILVDDGSLDSSISVAKKLVGNDSRFAFLHQENRGQGAARNLGLDHAKGDYIAFIDSDDYVEPDYLKLVYEKLIADDADICICNVNYVGIAGNVIRTYTSNPKKHVEDTDFFLARSHLSPWLWDKLYKKEVFEGMRFDESIRTFEDVHFTFRLIYNKKITQVPEYLYNYLQRPGSSSHDIKPSYIEDRVAVKDRYLSFAKSIGQLDSDYVTYAYLKTFICSCIVKLAKYSTDFYTDVEKLNKEIDPSLFTYKNVLRMTLQEPDVGLSLLLFKLSPTFFKQSTSFLFKFILRNRVVK